MTTSTYTGQIIPPAGVPLTSTIGIWANITNPSNSLQFTDIGFSLPQDIPVENEAKPITITAKVSSWSWSMSATLPGLLVTVNTKPEVAGAAFYTAPAASFVLVDAQVITSATNFNATTANFSTDSQASQTATSTGSPSTTPSPVVPASTQSKYTAGQLTGVAVGCLVAGLLLTTLFFWIFLRRRLRANREAEKTNKEIATIKNGGDSKFSNAGGTAAWQMGLPQPDADGVVKSLSSRSLDEIELLVEEFYSQLPMSTNERISASDLSSLSSPYLPGTLSDLLTRTQNPTVVIKHCIAHFLIRRIDTSVNSSQSFLPGYYSIPQNQTSLGLNETKMNRLAVSQLRVLTAHLQPDPQQDETYRALRAGAIAQAVQQIDRAFQPWARGDSNARQKALTGIMIHISELGIKLFSQPASFNWIWTQSGAAPLSSLGQRNTNEIIMLPGLDKTADQRGEAIIPALHLLKPRMGPCPK